MNGEITFFGVSENLDCVGVRKVRKERWDEVHVERLTVPHMLHLLRIQGLPVASIFSGELRYDGKVVNLCGWMVAKCSFPKPWHVPQYLRNIVLVKGDSREETMRACLRAHKKN